MVPKDSRRFLVAREDDDALFTLYPPASIFLAPAQHALQRSAQLVAVVLELRLRAATQRQLRQAAPVDVAALDVAVHLAQAVQEAPPFTSARKDRPDPVAHNVRVVALGQEGDLALYAAQLLAAEAGGRRAALPGRWREAAP
ncbi:hypothetical protein TSOC_000225 [Tetrabaena socialis]|uniref:Uncharacterized protein n=1 Tax=Tetrabaena socialis TaxID=47790 RepID=A0A2J8AJX6_9CHLO|nr:hypothetical protein TSOC_000225 [Tetrabaena socialis]|eukprot:PNH12824.1 hypothetical protein TSOC_000225 [Tetrabaena socialis]